MMNNINQYLTPINFSDANRSKASIKYIVVHYVGALGGAKDNCVYFSKNWVGASAHYFVGHDGEIWQSVLDEDIAWHCGTTGTYFHSYCRNSNSIGVEMCCRQRSDGTWYFEDETVKAAIELVKYLMDKYDVPASNVIRHYDVTHKTCPRPYALDVNAWNGFKNQLSDGTASNIQSEQSTEDTKYHVGDIVSTCILASNPNGGNVYDGKWAGSITRVVPGKKYPYLLNNGTGWTNDAGIEPKTTTTSKPVEVTPSTSLKYKVGQTVKINGIYKNSRTTEKLTPLKTTGVITSILEGANNPYLLDYGQLGWVNDDVIISYNSNQFIKVGSKVKVTNPYDEKGRRLYVSGTYNVIEVSGDRVVIGKGKTVTAAIHIDNLKLV